MSATPWTAAVRFHAVLRARRSVIESLLVSPALSRRSLCVLLVPGALSPGLHPVEARSASSAMAHKHSLDTALADIVDRIESGPVSMDVAYGSHKVHDAATLTPDQASFEPSVRLHGADPDVLYTLICSDPDPPDPANPIYREWLHWLVTDIPGGKEAKAKAGKCVVPYMGPAPPVGTHRYAFLLFKQPGQDPLRAEDPTKGHRKHFKTRSFAEAHNLGHPVAATYFYAHK